MYYYGSQKKSAAGPTNDILVETFDVDVSSDGQTHTLTNDVGSLSSAFVWVNNCSRRSSAGRTDSTANGSSGWDGVGVELTATDTITFRRLSTATGTVKVVGEVWRYVGAPGGANEFIVRSHAQVSVAAGTSSGSTAIAGITDRNDCIPFNNGCEQSANGNSASFHTICYALHLDSSNNLVASKNNTAVAGQSYEVYSAVVEFTGSNWSVGHAISSAHDTALETVTLNTDSTGAGGSTFDVGNWDNAFIEASMGGDSTETGLADTMAEAYPAGTTTQVVFGMFAFDGSSRNDADAYIHVAVNSNMTVTRDRLSNVAEGNGTYGTVGFPAGTNLTRDITHLALEWYPGTTGTGNAHARGALGARITDAGGTVQHWVHRSGNTVDISYGIIDLSQVTS